MDAFFLSRDKGIYKNFFLFLKETCQVVIRTVESFSFFLKKLYYFEPMINTIVKIRILRLNQACFFIGDGVKVLLKMEGPYHHLLSMGSQALINCCLEWDVQPSRMRLHEMETNRNIRVMSISNLDSYSRVCRLLIADVIRKRQHNLNSTKYYRCF